MHVDLSFLPALAAAFILAFARIGMMVTLLPGLGEAGVPVRVRLAVALALTVVLLPLHQSAYQVDLKSFAPMLSMLGEEIFVGAVLGLAARLTMSALQVAGFVIAQQMGLGFVTEIDPSQAEQNVIMANFLSMLGIALIFAVDLHHLVIAALDESYSLFAPGEVPLLGDVAALSTRTVAEAFRIGIQLSAPFLVFGVLFNVGLGLLSRLMPQMQVFFVGLPLTIMGGLLILAFVLGTMMTVFLADMRHMLGELALHG